MQLVYDIVVANNSMSDTSYPPGFSPVNTFASSSPPDLEDGELLPQVGCEKKEGVVPEFRPGKSGKVASSEDGKIVSVFVDNIPAGFNASWLRKSFNSFGKIVDSYIPGHKSRATNSLYGFVRFVGSSAAFSAISRMDGFWAGNNQLLVREARFSKFSGISRRKSQLSENTPYLYPNPKLGPILGFEHLAPSGVRSYAQVLTGANQECGSNAVQKKKHNICGVQSSLGWLENSVIALSSGRYNFEDLSAHLFISMKGLQNISKWGGRKLILQFQSKIAATEALAENKWPEYLSELCPWKGELVNPMRLVWLSCVSLPLSVWNLDSFKLIAGLWGNLVAVDESTFTASDLSKARLLIETEALELGGVIEVRAGESVFDVVVKEEGRGSAIGFWPECWPECKAVLLNDLGSFQYARGGKDDLSVGPLKEISVDILPSEQALGPARVHQNFDGVGHCKPTSAGTDYVLGIAVERDGNLIGNRASDGNFFTEAEVKYDGSLLSPRRDAPDPKVGWVGSSGVLDSVGNISSQEARPCEIGVSPISGNCVTRGGSGPSGILHFSPVARNFKAFDPGPISNLVTRCPMAVKFGPKWSINMCNKSSRKARKEVRQRQVSVPIAGSNSIAAEIDNTRRVADLIGVSFAGVGDNCIRKVILEEKMDIRNAD